MNHILIIRFSSMGDVLLCIPVISGLIKANPGLKVSFLTKDVFSPYLKGIEGLNVVPADLKNEFKGIKGLIKLSKSIKQKVDADAVFDLHDVLRSRILCFFLSFSGLSIFRIIKGRKEKKAYLSGKNRKELVHMTERYKDVFLRAGLNLSIDPFPFGKKTETEPLPAKRKIRMGLAPFAKHETKSWPFDYTLELLSILNARFDMEFHFYGGKMDAGKLLFNDFEEDNIFVHAGKLSALEERESISGLDLFLSMDSSNMHLADMLGIEVISIWGATHPDLGFRPLNQNPGNSIVSGEELPCRPCSVYGGKKCSLKDTKHKCLISISPHQVAEKIITSLSV